MSFPGHREKNPEMSSGQDQSQIDWGYSAFVLGTLGKRMESKRMVS